MGGLSVDALAAWSREPFPGASVAEEVRVMVVRMVPRLLAEDRRLQSEKVERERKSRSRNG